MPSPFPGMDPYLELPSLWPDVHGGLIYAIRAALTLVLPERYSAGVDQTVWVHEPDLETRRQLGSPDTFVADDFEATTNGPTTTAALASLAAPAVSTLPVVRRTGPRTIRITDHRQRRVVTAIEVLSPANKTLGEDRDSYLAKRNDYLASGVNLVEIDLLRAGRPFPLGKPFVEPGDYRVIVCRADAFPHVGVWAFTVRDPLPEIPVPLADDDPPVRVGLGPCFDRAYYEGRYKIDYTHPPTPRLRKADAAWAKERLAAKG